MLSTLEGREAVVIQCFFLMPAAADPQAGFGVAMLRIWLASGEELAPVSRQKIRVWDLKRHLRTEHGFPACLQRLISGGVCLEDAHYVTSPCELQLLLSMDACKQQKLAVGAELVSYAAEEGSARVTQFLLRVCPDKDFHGQALRVAAHKGRAEVARLLVEAGADTNSPDAKHKTALIHASSSGHTKIAELLLDAGAHKDACDLSGKSALAHALCNGHIEIAHRLLDAGADKDLRGLDGRCSPSLILAACAGDTEIIQLLLDAGVDCSEALMPAACHGHSEIVRLLLDKDVRALDGESALAHAASNGHTEVVRLLVEAGAVGQ